jgi:hypothetical protein
MIIARGALARKCGGMLKPHALEGSPSMSIRDEVTIPAVRHSTQSIASGIYRVRE